MIGKSGFLRRFFLTAVCLFVTACKTEPLFLKELRSSGKWGEYSDEKGIDEKSVKEFKTDSLATASATCRSEMPKIDEKVTGGGIESSCLQESMGKYSCICLLKLHEKNKTPFKKYVFYLKK